MKSHTLIFKKRKEQNLSQEEMAATLKISFSSYNRYETYKRIPNACIAVQMAKMLRSSVEELWGDALQVKPA